MLKNDHVFFWATVESLNPLTVRRDGETAPMGVAPSSLVNLGNATAVVDLAEGDRVWCQLHNRRALIVGRAGGLPRNGSFTAAMPGTPGMMFAANRTDSTQGPGLWFSQEGNASGSDAALWTTKAASTEHAAARRLNVRGPSGGDGIYFRNGPFEFDGDIKVVSGGYTSFESGASGYTHFRRRAYFDQFTYLNNNVYMSGAVATDAQFDKNIRVEGWIRNPGRAERTSGANVYMGGTGEYLWKNTSVRRAKVNIETFEGNAERILDLEPRIWIDRTDIEMAGGEAAALIEDTATGPVVDEAQLAQLLPYGKLPRRVPGLVAEEVEAVGLSEYAVYDDAEDGGDPTLQSVSYDRLWTLLIPLVRDQRDQIAALQDRVAALEAQLTEPKNNVE